MPDLQPMLARIKKLKKEHGYTNEQLARAAGIPVSTLGKFLAGIIKDPSVVTFIKIAKALGASADYLIFGESKATPALYSSLGDEGRKKADEYIELLARSGLYGASEGEKTVFSIAAEKKISTQAVVPDEARHT